ncbi:DUF2058 domain-containing protein [Catenovulum agarivorans]|nr:DUF2058 family protein [Catenovulum agarivorans]
MAKSLAEQLMQAGVVNQKQAKKASKKSKKNRELKREVQAAVQQTQQQNVQKSDQQNEKIRLEAQQKAITAQIKQLIEVNAIESKGDLEHNFNFEGKVKTLRVSSQQKQQLANGFIAIAHLGEKFYMLPAAVAEKIEQRGEGYIVLLNDKIEEDEDDPYKDYPIPDDLMW